MKKYFLILLLIMFVVPSIVSATWWNPVSWFDEITTQPASTITTTSTITPTTTTITPKTTVIPTETNITTKTIVTPTPTIVPTKTTVVPTPTVTPNKTTTVPTTIVIPTKTDITTTTTTPTTTVNWWNPFSWFGDKKTTQPITPTTTIILPKKVDLSPVIVPEPTSKAIYLSDKYYFGAGEPIIAVQIYGKFYSRALLAQYLSMDRSVGEYKGKIISLFDILYSMETAGSGNVATWKVAGPQSLIKNYLNMLQTKADDGIIDGSGN